MNEYERLKLYYSEYDPQHYDSFSRLITKDMDSVLANYIIAADDKGMSYEKRLEAEKYMQKELF